jgi:hypothetical protein
MASPRCRIASLPAGRAARSLSMGPGRVFGGLGRCLRHRIGSDFPRLRVTPRFMSISLAQADSGIEAGRWQQTASS